jgi:hypothetical protein
MRMAIDVHVRRTSRFGSRRARRWRVCTKSPLSRETEAPSCDPRAPSVKGGMRVGGGRPIPPGHPTSGAERVPALPAESEATGSAAPAADWQPNSRRVPRRAAGGRCSWRVCITLVERSAKSAHADRRCASARRVGARAPADELHLAAPRAAHRCSPLGVRERVSSRSHDLVTLFVKPQNRGRSRDLFDSLAGSNAGVLSAVREPHAGYCVPARSPRCDFTATTPSASSRSMRCHRQAHPPAPDDDTAEGTVAARPCPPAPSNVRYVHPPYTP